MVQAADRLLALMPRRLRATALVPFDRTEIRHRISYTPRLHPGVPLGALTEAGRKAAMQLLATALSPLGYAKVVAVMGLEEVLDRQEDWTKGRQMLGYWVAVFGRPGQPPWGWRFEGHHVSVTMTVTDNGIWTTPLFLGAHPATVEATTGPVTAPLLDEDHLGLTLIGSLPDQLLAQALVSEQAPPDIHSGTGAHFTTSVRPQGVTGWQMPRLALELLAELVSVYDQMLNPDVLDAQPVRCTSLEELSFAWQGDLRGTGPRYYRVQGPHLLIEHSLTIGAAGHVHSVRRIPGHDFGR